MDLALRIDNNIMAIIVSIIFLINITRRLDKKEESSKVFVNIFLLNTIQLITETLTCIINRQPYGWLIPLTYILHIFLFILGPTITYMWYVFASLWTNKEFNWREDVFISFPLIINIFIVLINPFFNLLFYITDKNVYERGPCFFIPVTISYFYLFYSFIFIYVNREKINRIDFLPLLLFGVFPALGGIIQAIFYGFLLLWSSISFALIILYIYLQQQMIHIDRLTGAWTREKLHSYLDNKIKQNKKRGFSVVFIDLDNFKNINDSFGHNEGDKALETIVRIIKSILPKGDSITRYGGDEFILLLNSGNREEVELIMIKISDALRNYNMHSGVKYNLEYSYGYEMYDFNIQMTTDEYIAHVDKLMYEAKRNKKIKCKN